MIVDRWHVQLAAVQQVNGCIINRLELKVLIHDPFLCAGLHRHLVDANASTAVSGAAPTRQAMCRRMGHDYAAA